VARYLPAGPLGRIILLDVAGRYARDPISEQFDAAAIKLLRRAYANKGEWVGTYVGNPSPAWQVWAVRNGWPRLLGPDPVPSAEAKTAWCRAFVRSCYHNNKKYMYLDGLRTNDPRPTGGRWRNQAGDWQGGSWPPPYALDFEVSPSVRIAPGGRVVGRSVRIKLMTGGRAAKKAAEKLPKSKRWDTGARLSGWEYTG
jgi:hypothetical protein